MSLRTNGAQANETSHFSTTRALSDLHLLIGEMLSGGVWRDIAKAKQLEL